MRNPIVRLFPFWCHKILPLVYDDSLSYYELLCKVVAKLNETIEGFNTFTATNQIVWRGAWNFSSSYPAWSIVQDTNGNGYISVQPVPPNTDISNEEYWEKIVDFDVFYQGFNTRLSSLETRVSDIETALNGVHFQRNAIAHGYTRDFTTSYNSQGIIFFISANSEAQGILIYDCTTLGDLVYNMVRFDEGRHEVEITDNGSNVFNITNAGATSYVYMIAMLYHGTLTPGDPYLDGNTRGAEPLNREDYDGKYSDTTEELRK